MNAVLSVVRKVSAGYFSNMILVTVLRGATPTTFHKAIQFSLCGPHVKVHSMCVRKARSCSNKRNVEIFCLEMERILTERKTAIALLSFQLEQEKCKKRAYGTPINVSHTFAKDNHDVQHLIFLQFYISVQLETNINTPVHCTVMDTNVND